MTIEDMLALQFSQRRTTYRFELLDVGLNTIGDLLVDSGRPPSIDNNTNRTIKRQMSGMRLHPSDAQHVDPMRDRVRVSMVLGDGSTWPLGVFIFSGYDRAQVSGKLTPSPTLHDQTVILDQPIPRTFSNPPGSLVTDNLLRHLQDLSLPAGVEIEASGARVSATSPMSWPAGTSRSVVLNETAAIAGFYSGYFDSSGVLQFRSPSPIGPDIQPDLDYRVTSGRSRIVADSVVLSDDLLDAPNRYIVVDSSSIEAPVVGVYDVPDDAPESAANRGYVVAKVYDAQGVGTVAQARRMAQTRYESSRSYEWVTFDAAADPRHDTFQTVGIHVEGLGDVVYREMSWRLSLDVQGRMRHELRRTYA